MVDSVADAHERPSLSVSEPLPTALLIGLGRLGLGLIAALHKPRAINMIVCGRESPTSSAVLSALSRDRGFTCVENGTPRFVELAGVSYLGTSDFAELVRSADTRVVLVAVKGGQPDVAGRLREILEGSNDPALPSLIVIPCENVVSSELMALQSSQTIRPVVVSTSMVDRVCTALEVDDSGVQVVTEEYAEWCTSSPPTIDPKSAAGASDLFVALGTTLSGDIDRVKDRKLFLMNFVQMNVAMLALNFFQMNIAVLDVKPEENDIRAFIEGTGAVDSELVSVYAAHALALRYPDEPFEAIDVWRARYLDRITTVPDTPKRILQRMVDGNYAAAMTDWAAKSEGPLKLLEREYEGWPDVFRRTVQIMSQMLGRPNRTPNQPESDDVPG